LRAVVKRKTGAPQRPETAPEPPSSAEQRQAMRFVLEELEQWCYVELTLSGVAAPAGHLALELLRILVDLDILDLEPLATAFRKYGGPQAWKRERWKVERKNWPLESKIRELGRLLSKWRGE
jgi:hypothetical protein